MQRMGHPLAIKPSAFQNVSALFYKSARTTFYGLFSYHNILWIVFLSGNSLGSDCCPSGSRRLAAVEESPRSAKSVLGFLAAAALQGPRTELVEVFFTKCHYIACIYQIYIYICITLHHSISFCIILSFCHSVSLYSLHIKYTSLCVYLQICTHTSLD